ncbi:MAG TPA: hypothetical protein VGT98_12325 [Candidatus Elarobacter sp.]|nr:hypothetical protein [Candidatus Elarobacter sp.]
MPFKSERYPEMTSWTKKHRANVFPHLPIALPDEARQYVLARIIAQILDEGEVLRYETDGTVHYFARVSWADRMVDMAVNAEDADVVLAGRLTTLPTMVVGDSDVPPEWLNATIRTAAAADLLEIAEEIQTRISPEVARNHLTLLN